LNSPYQNFYEKIAFHNFNATHAATKNHQVTITFMENQGNILINTEKMKVDEHSLVLIKNPQGASLNAP